MTTEQGGFILDTHLYNAEGYITNPTVINKGMVSDISTYHKNPNNSESGKLIRTWAILLSDTNTPVQGNIYSTISIGSDGREGGTTFIGQFNQSEAYRNIIRANELLNKQIDQYSDSEKAWMLHLGFLRLVDNPSGSEFIMRNPYVINRFKSLFKDNVVSVNMDEVYGTGYSVTSLVDETLKPGEIASKFNTIKMKSRSLWRNAVSRILPGIRSLLIPLPSSVIDLKPQQVTAYRDNAPCVKLRNASQIMHGTLPERQDNDDNVLHESCRDCIFNNKCPGPIITGQEQYDRLSKEGLLDIRAALKSFNLDNLIS